jgi:hypothetical protein
VINYCSSAYKYTQKLRFNRVFSLPFFSEILIFEETKQNLYKMSEEVKKDPRDLNGDGKVSLGEKVQFAAEKAGEKIEAAIADAKEDAKVALGEAKELYAKASDKAKDMYAEAKESAKDLYDKAADKVQDLKDKKDKKEA